jgi:hypothetical protein
LNSAAFTKGLHYLQRVQQLALEPDMVVMEQNLRDRTAVCTWIGEHIDAINAALYRHLMACYNCFYAQNRPTIQVLAAPLSPAFGIDAQCNILAQPTTILIDVGRVAAPDWLAIVAHEYAHAQVGHPGHTQEFYAVLSHLCLGLGLEPPDYAANLSTAALDAALRSWPHCRAMADPLAFWRGLAAA